MEFYASPTATPGITEGTMFQENDQGDLVDGGIFTMLIGNTYFLGDDGHWYGSAVCTFEIEGVIPGPVNGMIRFTVNLLRFKVEIVGPNQVNICVISVA